MNHHIGWLSPTTRPENVITDSTGNEVTLTPEQLAIYKEYEQADTEAMAELMSWGNFETIEEAKAFLNTQK